MAGEHPQRHRTWTTPPARVQSSLEGPANDQFVALVVLMVFLFGERGTLHRTRRQPCRLVSHPSLAPNAASFLCSLHPSTTTPSHAIAMLSRQMHRASHARLSFPHSLIATLPVFPEFYIAFTVCFYDV